MIEKRSGQNHRVTKWSGGLTTELAISPAEALYADRNFLWRISSATVETEKSDFTPLPDYERRLMILCGALRIRHDGGAWEALPAYREHRFDGASHTESEGKVTDFNLMLKKGACEGSLSAISFEETASVRISEQADAVLIYCVEREIKLFSEQEPEHSMTLCAGESLFLTENDAKKPWIAEGDRYARAVTAKVKNLKTELGSVENKDSNT